jgi:glutathione S-transferase
VPLPFEQLCWDETPMGVLGLRCRTDPTLGAEVYEVKLGDEYLMSSHFTVAEVALATLGLAPLEGDWLEVVVGALPEAIAWHEQGLLPDVAQVFAHAAAEVVTFDNPLAGGVS